MIVVDRREKMTLAERLYLKEVSRGLLITARHFVRNMFYHIAHVFGIAKDTDGAVTLQYPDVPARVAKRYRGRHRLTRRNDGSPKCVACFMCATACPDNCINIVGGEKEDQSETEKYPIVYELDIARCCFCGMCVEACPEDAIRMDTGHVEFSDFSRKSLLYDKDTLLSFEPVDDVWR
jgi:NADH-quinone oxidoreductase subunit I